MDHLSFAMGTEHVCPECGAVYRCDEDTCLGKPGTDEHWGYGWNSRKGRRDQRLSKKMRWFRTP